MSNATLRREAGLLAVLISDMEASSERTAGRLGKTAHKAAFDAFRARQEEIWRQLGEMEKGGGK